jgi:hypothetical protein
MIPQDKFTEPSWVGSTLLAVFHDMHILRSFCPIRIVCPELYCVVLCSFVLYCTVLPYSSTEYFLD